MPPLALHVERFTPQPVPLAQELLTKIGQQAVGGHLQVVEGESADHQAMTSVVPDLTRKQLKVITLTAHGRAISQILKGSRSLTRGDVVGIQEDLQDTFEVPTTSAVVHQMIVREMLPVEHEPDKQRTSRLTDQDKSTAISYAAGEVPVQIARGLGMTMGEFIQHEKELHAKIGSRSRPNTVFLGHKLGLFRLGLAEVVRR